MKYPITQKDLRTLRLLDEERRALNRRAKQLEKDGQDIAQAMLERLEKRGQARQRAIEPGKWSVTITERTCPSWKAAYIEDCGEEAAERVISETPPSFGIKVVERQLQAIEKGEDFRRAGSVLILTIFFVLVIAALAGALVQLTLMSSRNLERREAETKCALAAETGISRALDNLGQYGSGELGFNLDGFSVTTTFDGEKITSEAQSDIVSGSGDPLYNATVIVHVVERVAQIPTTTSVYVSAASANGASSTVSGGTACGVLTPSPGDIDLPNVSGTPAIEAGTVDVHGLYGDLARIADDPTFGGGYGIEGNPRITALKGPVKITGNKEGYGALLIDGSLEIAGTLSFQGVIVVTGDVTLSGGGSSLLLRGALFAGGAIKINGGVDLAYDATMINKVQSIVDSAYQAYEIKAWRTP